MAHSVVGNDSETVLNPQTLILDTFFPGFSVLSSAISRYLKIDISLYFPLLLIIGLVVFAQQYFNEYLWNQLESWFMSTADIRVDDEIYNMFMAWVAGQKFAKNSRRFVVNTNLNSRSWYLWYDTWQDDEDGEGDLLVEDDMDTSSSLQGQHGKKKTKALQYTPSFGSHYFWYRGHLLLFKREQSTGQSYIPASEREEISVSSFGRNPKVLKQLLDECRVEFMKYDEKRTLIYRGGFKPGSAEPTWTRCMSRVSRPLSTVVMDESVKETLLEDMRDYLNPLTQRYYSNRGIPYRRGYLLYGPAGTGKSSFSLVIAGLFKLKIYIVSLNSMAMNEENLATLFAELPQRCVVLLEDIDTAGLTHTRNPDEAAINAAPSQPKAAGTETEVAKSGRISLSALLNVLDGVASQEGRILIMTTNHVEKLDDALIRPGRVDMMVKFDLADDAMNKKLFEGIFATLEGDIPKAAEPKEIILQSSPLSKGKFLPVLSSAAKAAGHISKSDADQISKPDAAELRKTEAETQLRISALAETFATIVPSRKFSPAEIQGFLLKNKRNPDQAIVNAAEWVKTSLAQKANGKERDKKGGEEDNSKGGNSFWNFFAPGMPEFGVA